MAMRFRKSVNLGGKTKLNINKKSASVSFGPKGMRTTISTSGRTTHTTSIPGTGVSYSTTNGTKSKQKSGGAEWKGPKAQEVSKRQCVEIALASAFLAVISVLAGNTFGLVGAIIGWMIAAVFALVCVVYLIAIPFMPSSKEMGEEIRVKKEPTVEQLEIRGKVVKIYFRVIAVLLFVIAVMLMLLALVYGIVCVIGSVACGWLAVMCWKKKTEVPESEE